MNDRSENRLENWKKTKIMIGKIAEDTTQRMGKKERRSEGRIVASNFVGEEFTEVVERKTEQAVESGRQSI